MNPANNAPQRQQGYAVPIAPNLPPVTPGTVQQFPQPSQSESYVHMELQRQLQIALGENQRLQAIIQQTAVVGPNPGGCTCSMAPIVDQNGQYFRILCPFHDPTAPRAIPQRPVRVGPVERVTKRRRGHSRSRSRGRNSASSH